MKNLIEKYGLTVLHSKVEATNLSRLYIEKGIIPASHTLDSIHVAMTSVYELEYIISYNFHHINRDKTKALTAIINNDEGYGLIIIATAKEVLEIDS